MSAQFVFSSFTTITVVAAVLTALRVWKCGLAARYPVLTTFLFFLAPYSGVPLLLDLHSAAYYYFWTATQPLYWILEVLLIRELCMAVLAEYPGVYTLGRWLMCGGILISTGISVLSLEARIKSTMSTRGTLLAIWTAGDRGVNLALAVFLLLMLFLVTRYPVRLSRNAVLNTAVFAVFFLSNTLGATLHWIFDLKLSLTIDACLAAASCICTIAWLLFLTPAGEKVVFHRLRYREDQERHLLGQLDMLNRVLLGGS